MNSARARANSVFPTPGRTQEQEAANRPFRIFQTRPGPQNRLGDGQHRFVLPDHALVKLIFQSEELFHLAFEQLGNGNTRPAADNFGDVFFVYLFFE